MGSSQSCCQCEEGSELYSSSGSFKDEDEKQEKPEKTSKGNKQQCEQNQNDTHKDQHKEDKVDKIEDKTEDQKEEGEVQEEEIKPTVVGEARNPLLRIDSLHEESAANSAEKGIIVKHVKQVVKYVVVDEDCEGKEIARSEEVVITKKEVLVTVDEPKAPFNGTRFRGTYLGLGLMCQCITIGMEFIW